jgi:hypothetical protein
LTSIAQAVQVNRRYQSLKNAWLNYKGVPKSAFSIHAQHLGIVIACTA